MTDVKIMVDTSSDMPKEIMDKYNIGMLDMISVFGETSYVMGRDMSDEEFFEKIQECEKLPTTAQTPYAEMYDVLLKEAKEHKSVIYFTISSKGSGQHQTARLVAEDIKEEYPEADIRIVDSKSFSIFITEAAIVASKLAQQDRSVEDIVKGAEEEMAKWQVRFLVGSLKYLEKGGRIRKTTATIGTLLDIRPVLYVNDGLIEQFDKIRGKKKIIDKLIGFIDDIPNLDTDNPRFMVLEYDKEIGDEVVEKLKERYGDDSVILYARFKAAVGTHIGPGTFGIFARTK